MKPRWFSQTVAAAVQWDFLTLAGGLFSPPGSGSHPRRCWRRWHPLAAGLLGCCCVPKTKTRAQGSRPAKSGRGAQRRGACWGPRRPAPSPSQEFVAARSSSGHPETIPGDTTKQFRITRKNSGRPGTAPVSDTGGDDLRGRLATGAPGRFCRAECARSLGQGRIITADP